MKRFCLIILLISPPALGQFNNPTGIWGGYLEKADMLYEQNFYEEAVIYYKKELEKFDFKQEVLLKLANCYRKLKDYKNENSYYSILAQTNSLDNPQDMFYYAESLLSTGDYENAITWYNNYLKEFPNDQLAFTRIKGIENIGSYYKDSTYSKVKSFSYNSEKTEFNARPFNGGVLFTSSREKDLIIKHDNLRQVESLLDIYYIPLLNEDPAITEPQRIKLPNHWKSNDGPVTIGAKHAVINRNNGKGKEDFYNSLGIQFYTFESEAWTYFSSFQYNDPSYSIMHPSFSADEDTIFFSSDMPGGFGGMDLFYSVFTGENWSRPVNLGRPVNTSADEVFPFAESGKLYFSSNGHEGLGGLDIYKWNKSEPEPDQIQNLGYPVNSGWDDFSIFIENNKGYLASNRPGGSGHDDIYEVELLQIPEEEIIVKNKLKLTVSDILNDDKIAFADVTLINKKDETEYKYLTSEEGEIIEMLDPSYYQMIVTKTGFEVYELEVDLLNNPLLVEEVYISPVFTFESINLDSILFEYNDFKLSIGAEKELDEIISIMNKYDQIGLEIAAHTDSRGEKEYNHWLSEMRAASTANYLIEKGIPFERININGYGESQLLNHCEDDVPCSEDEHMVNRRIEFLFLTELNKEE